MGRKESWREIEKNEVPGGGEVYYLMMQVVGSELCISAIVENYLVR